MRKGSDMCNNGFQDMLRGEQLSLQGWEWEGGAGMGGMGSGGIGGVGVSGRGRSGKVLRYPGWKIDIWA